MAAVCDSPSEAMLYLQKVLALNPGHAAAKKGVEYYQGKIRKAQGAATASGAIRAIDAGDGSGVGLGTTSSFGPDSGTRLGAGQQPARKLLVVDESRTTRKLIAMAAAGDGMCVVEASDATDAAHRILEDGPPDLVLIDVALPGVDGYEFCKLIRNNPTTRQVPIVLMTGKEGIRDKIRSAVAGVSAVATKPLNPDELMRTIRACLAAEPAPTA
jgi:twitching motility two-component system response regulator PilG